MEIKVVSHTGQEVGDKLKMRMERYNNFVREAMRETAKEVGEIILFECQEDIEAAGNFGDDWTEALEMETEETQRTITLTLSMNAKHPPVTYWKVFEYGADISAKNPSGMMWIPFERKNKVWPRDYSGELYRAGNVLFDEATDVPMYLGTPEVHIPKKFHLHEIAEAEAKKAGDILDRILGEMREG